MAHLQSIYRGLRLIGLVLFYYIFSIGITFYNKWLMTVSISILCHHQYLIDYSCVIMWLCSVFLLSLKLAYYFSQDFHYPLFMTLVHITIIFSLSAATRRILHSWTGKPRIILNWADYLQRVAPTGTSP